MVFSEALESVNLKMSHEKCEGHVHKSTYDCIYICVNYFQRNSDRSKMGLGFVSLETYIIWEALFGERNTQLDMKFNTDLE